MKRVIPLAAGLLTLAHVASAATTDSHTLFLNDCLPDGCDVRLGNTDATTDTSDLPRSHSTVQAFNQGDAAWSDVLACVKSVMAPFDLTVTDQRPTSGKYFEVMVAGLPGDIGLDSGTVAIGDVCDGTSCSDFRSNALAFAFANSSYYVGRTNDLCAASLQAIAASWRLDHVVLASDVMSYNAYSGVRTFHDGVACGSDCVDGKSPFGMTCAGSGGLATHSCYGTGTDTQDEVQMLLALFGPAPASNGAGGQGGADNGSQGGAAGEAGKETGGTAGSVSEAGAGGEAGAHEGGAAGASHGSPAKSSSGCGCRVVAERSPSAPWLVLSLPLALAFRRRSRRHVLGTRAA